jgi:hypothetical protein
LFEFYTAFERIKLADGINTINMCVINLVDYDFLYIIDLDGSFRPNPAIAPTVSTAVASDNQMHLTFLDPSKCVANTAGCYSYCHDTCFRSMRYSVDGPGQELYKLKVCSRSDHSRCSLFKGGRRGTSGSHDFTAHLPAGQLYDAVFLDGSGKEIIPARVQESVEKTFCTSGIFEVKLYNTMGPATPTVPPPVPVPVVTIPVAAPIIVPLPVAAPVKAPAKAPALPAPIRAPALPAPVLVAGPTADTCKMIQWYLYDAKSDLMVTSLLEGSIISTPPPCGQVNIEAFVPCVSGSATVIIDLFDANNRLVLRRKETSPKYFLFGNTGSDVTAGRINAGTYVIRATVNGVVYPSTRFTLGGICR